MIRKIIKIDQERCNGCALCAGACHENAIKMENGVATLVREDYCDGLGDCLPACPVGAISFEEREAPAYDEAAVKANQQRLRDQDEKDGAGLLGDVPSRIAQWPVQIKLAPEKSAMFDGAHLLIAADCTAFAYGNFHDRFLKGRKLLIACPKLDDTDYSQKLAAICAENNIQSVTVLRMEVPCCGGLPYYAEQALKNCGKNLPYKVITISVEGNLCE